MSGVPPLADLGSLAATMNAAVTGNENSSVVCSGSPVGFARYSRSLVSMSSALWTLKNTDCPRGSLACRPRRRVFFASATSAPLGVLFASASALPCDAEACPGVSFDALLEVGDSIAGWL